MPPNSPRSRFIVRVTFGYAVFAALWIVVSDHLLKLLPNVQDITWLAMAKGLGFVLVTAALLYKALQAVPAPESRQSVGLIDALVLKTQNRVWPTWAAYAFALAISITCLVARVAFASAIGESPMSAVLVPVFFSIAPLCLSALAGGLGPGLLATAITSLGFDALVIGPVGQFKMLQSTDLTGLAFITTGGCVLSLVCEMMHRARRSIHLDRRVLESLVSGTTDAIYVKDCEGRYVFCNEAAAQLLGRASDEIIGRKDIEVLPARSADVLKKADLDVVEAGLSSSFEERLSMNDGREITLQSSKGPVHDGAGKIVGIFGISRDITERKRAETLQLEQAAVLEMIARNAPIDQTLERLVRGIESQAGDIACSILLFDEANSCLRHGAAPGLPEAYNRAVDGLVIGPRAGSCGTAAFLRRQIIVEDITADDRWADFQPLASQIDFRACWSNPVIDAAGSLLGTFAVYNRRPGRPSPRHIELVEDATHTAAICIGSARVLSALRESEQRFSRIFETSPIGIRLSRRDDTRCVDANDTWLKLTGYAREEAIGGTSEELGLWVDRQAHGALLEVQKDGRTVRDIEVTLRKKSGEIFEALFSAGLVQISGCDYVLTTLVDNTLQKRAQRALENQREQLEALVAARTSEIQQTVSYLRALIDTLPYYIWLKDTEGRFLVVNRAHAESIGRDAEDFVGRTDFDIWPAERASAHREADIEVMATGRTKHYEQPLFHATRTVVVETLKSPVVDHDGRIIGTVGFARDISDQKALESERESARQAAENLARTKSAFLANMSHEIRTPLNGVLGLASIGYQESHGHRSQQTFGRIMESGKLLLGIIDDILDFSKIEAGKLSVESVPIELRSVIRQVVDLTRAQSDAKGLSLTTETADDLPALCLGDPVRLTQVILNLVSNAIKFTPRGSIAVSAARDGCELVLSVSDTGIGISAEQLSILFRPFEQADSSTTRNFGGTGLGLAITKRLVELMAGRIEVRSQVGIGTTFLVRLPLRPAPDESQARQPSVSSQNARRLAGLRILAAEDGEINRIVLETLLANDGAEVVMVTTGREAVDRIAQEGAGAFDLVLMDIQMPEMDGYQAARLILQQAPDLPIVGQTAHVLAEDRASCLQSGMCDYIAKPLEPEKLSATILRHVRKLQAQNQG